MQEQELEQQGEREAAAGEEDEVGGDVTLARLLGWDCDSDEVRRAVEVVRECTGVSAELAEYALRSAKVIHA